MSEKRETAAPPASGPADAEAQEIARLRDLAIQAGKLAELGTQVASLVHEMNQPLVAIKAFAQMLRSSVDDPTGQRRAAFIEDQAEALEQLVSRIRRYARQGQTVDAHVRSDVTATVAVVLELVEHSLRRAGATLDVDVEEGPLLVPLDSVHVQQILVNLLVNAADAVEGREVRRIRLTVGRGSGEVRVQVEDTGAGIPQGLEDQVLEPFFTTKDEDRGTGLGLSICREIAEACGGRILIGTPSDVGADEAYVTSIQVVLPAVAGPAEIAEVEEEANE